MIDGYTIRNISVAPGLVLAPMSGVTCAAFRRLLRRCNPGCIGLVVSEFISVEGLTRDSRRSLQMLKFYPEERPVAIQIFGYDADRMRDAALMVQDVGADIVDINCGCPAPKVVRNGGGCELMRQPAQLQKILANVRQAVSIPLTMKFRAGWDSQSVNAVEIARLAEGEGVEAVAVHGRTRAQLYHGDADWNVVRAVRDAVKIPVAGSGDVQDAPSAEQRLRMGRVHGLFVGRAAIRNPFVFTDIQLGRARTRLTDVEMFEVLRQYHALLEEDFLPQHRIGRMKQLVTQMAKGRPWAKAVVRAQSESEIRSALAVARDQARESQPALEVS